jgi:hypothetical protein
MTIPDDSVEKLFAGLADGKRHEYINVYRENGQCVLQCVARDMKFTAPTFADTFREFCHVY